MISISEMLCGHEIGNDPLRYRLVDLKVGSEERTEGPAGKAHERTIGARPESLPRQRPPLFPAAPRPVVEWAVTSSGSLRCVQQDLKAARRPEDHELSFEEGIALLDDLRAFGVPALTIRGGKSLYRTDTPDLIAHAQSIGIATTLSTNGLLIDDKMADRLAAVGLKTVEISLDGSRAHHDELCGIRGAFNESLAAVDRCRVRGIEVALRFTVHALNREDLNEIFQICHDHDVTRLCVYHAGYSGQRGTSRTAELSAFETRSLVNRIFRLTAKCHEEGRPLEVVTAGNQADAAYVVLLLERIDRKWADKIEGKLIRAGGNRAGCTVAAIDSVGNVHYDQFSYHYSCGNVRQQRFSSIWGEPFDERLQILRDRWSYLPARCRACRFLALCNGNSRSRAEAATGDWLGLDPACYITGEEILAL